MLIAVSFADIFYHNCLKNGMLPIALSEEVVDDLFRRAGRAGYELVVCLETCTITDADGLEIEFEIDPHHRHCLWHGLDDICQTLEHEQQIVAYEKARGMAPLGAQ